MNNIFYFHMQVGYKFFNFLYFLFFQAKRVNHYEVHAIFKKNSISALIKYPVLLSFHEIFFHLRCFCNPLKIIYRWCLWHCLSIQIIYVPILKIWWFFIFIIIFHAFIISFHISIKRVTYSTYFGNFFLSLTSYQNQLKK